MEVCQDRLLCVCAGPRGCSREVQGELGSLSLLGASFRGRQQQEAQAFPHPPPVCSRWGKKESSPHSHQKPQAHTELGQTRAEGQGRVECRTDLTKPPSPRAKHNHHKHNPVQHKEVDHGFGKGTMKEKTSPLVSLK